LSGGVRSLLQAPLVERRWASAPEAFVRGDTYERGARRIPLVRFVGYASVGVPLPFLFFVARMERSEIRVRHFKPKLRSRITLRSIRATCFFLAESEIEPQAIPPALPA
jgi:hypothetical protein